MPVGEPNFDGKTIIAAAAEVGYFEIFKWLHEQGCPWDDRVTIAAGYHIGNFSPKKMGHFKILEYAFAHGCPFSEKTATAAVHNLGLLLWLQKKGVPISNTHLWSARQAPSLEVLEWSFQNGIPPPKHHPLQVAALGDLEALMWLHAKGCTNFTDCTLFTATLHGHWKCVEFLVKSGCPYRQNLRKTVERRYPCHNFDWLPLELK
jgi:hypothetical protein